MVTGSAARYDGILMVQPLWNPGTKDTLESWIKRNPGTHMMEPWNKRNPGTLMVEPYDGTHDPRMF